MLFATTLTTAFLVASAAAGVADLVAEGVLVGRSAELERRMLSTADVDEFAPLAVVAKRQSSDVVLNQNGTINMTAWDAQASAACTQALSTLPQASNPSGTCICYNLPALDNVTGTFEADLRLFQLNSPTGDFTGIAAKDIQVGLSYSGASVSPVSASAASKKIVSKVVGRQSTQSSTDLKLLQTYLFVGQIDKSKMTTDMNMATLQALVMPVVTLSAVNSAGTTVSTNVSSNEAAFVTGVFSTEVVMSDTAKAQAAVDDIVAKLKTSEVAFVLPGVQLLIFPVGLVVTSVWLVAGVAVIGLGFFERVSYREQYRSRTARAGKGSFMKRI
ncbi:hypothetical protein NKR23_g9111 [Pleurostoma richardsiae]|uniref:Uncharacterized protein n=1 Tax=Pleurostoma richardsiae TaxID=41990 RepID=A0AA38RGH1_9PEZI|nr:hypothetical protein NKR23_g9111 [Pleurostoma richardsiae]